MFRALRRCVSGITLSFIVVSAAAAADVVVENPRIRLLPGDLPAAGYFLLRNTGTEPVVLVAAASPAFAETMMHRSSEKNGMVGMSMVAQVVLKPGASIEFSPGGYHLMLMRRTKPLAVGDVVPVELRFRDGQRLQVEFNAVSPAAR